MKRDSAKQRGMTLIEVTLAVGILALVVSVGYSALIQILGTKKLLDDRRDTAAVVNAVMGRFIRELQLSAAVSPVLPPRDSPESRYPPRTFLIGEPEEAGARQANDKITFVAMEGGQYVPDGGTHNGLVQITYRLAEDPENAQDRDTYVLVREETPLIRPVERAYKDSMIFPVANNVLSMRFDFYDVDESAWTRTWSPGKKSGLPGLIRFVLTFRSPAGTPVTVGTTVPIRGAGRSSP